MDVSSSIITFHNFHIERVNVRLGVCQSLLMRFASQVHFFESFLQTNHCIEEWLTWIVEGS